MKPLLVLPVFSTAGRTAPAPTSQVAPSSSLNSIRIWPSSVPFSIQANRSSRPSSSRSRQGVQPLSGVASRSICASALQVPVVVERVEV